MASIKLKGDTSGEITISAPAVAGTNTLTIPAETGNVLTDGSALPAIDGSALTNLPAASALTTASGSAPSYSARAWVNFNGTGTVAIRGSANVTSITDRAVGRYTVNLTTAMSSTNYATISSSADATEGSMRCAQARVNNTSSYLIYVENGNSSYTDAEHINSCVFE